MKTAREREREREDDLWHEDVRLCAKDVLNTDTPSCHVILTTYVLTTLSH